MSAGQQAGPGAGSGPAEEVGRLAAASVAAGDPTGWFEELYAAAARGDAVVPWDRGTPHWLLTEWAEGRALDGAGQRAMVVGCGLGADAEYVAGLGFDTVAFDISATAVRLVRERFPGSAVDYQVADLLDPPAAWDRSFDLVVESQTIQALPDPARREATAQIARMVAPGGRLVVICLAREPDEPPAPHPPWSITRAEVGAFEAAGLAPVRVEDLPDAGRVPPGRRWRAEFVRPAR